MPPDSPNRNKDIDTGLDGVKKEASQRSWDSAYSKAESVATLPGGQAKLAAALDDPTCKNLLPNLQVEWGKKNRELVDKNHDGSFSKKEVEDALASPTKSSLDQLMLERLNKNFKDVAKAEPADGDTNTVSLSDLTKTAKKADERQVAADIQRAMPDQIAFKTFDHMNTGEGEGKLTLEEVRKLKPEYDRQVADAGFASRPAQERQQLQVRKTAVDALSDEETFKKIAGEGNTAISYENVKNFIDGANAKPPEVLKAADAISKTMATNFKDVGSIEQVDGKPETRINKTDLAAKLDKLDRLIETNDRGPEAKKSNERLREIYQHMKDPAVFDEIASSSNDGGTGISMKDIQAYQRIRSPQFAEDIRNLFPEKLAAGISKEDVTARLQQEKTAVAVTGRPTAEQSRQMEALSTLLEGTNFERLAHRADTPLQAASDSPASTLDSKDLDALKAEQSKLLTLPKEVQGATGSTDARASTDATATKSAEVRTAVKKMFEGAPLTKVDGNTPLKIDERGLAIADYGAMQIGYHFTNGQVDAVFKDPNILQKFALDAKTGKKVEAKPGIFEKDGDRWVGRPNGSGISDGQYELSGALDVDQNGKFTRMLSGKMGKDHQPEAGSAYQVWVGKTEGLNTVVSNYTMETDGSAYGMSYVHDQQRRIDYLPARPNDIKDDKDLPWQHLARQKDTKGNFTNNYKGNITTLGSDGQTLVPNTPYMMSNPQMETDGTFSYGFNRLAGNNFTPSGSRAYHLPDGRLKWNEPIEARQKREDFERNFPSNTDKLVDRKDIIADVSKLFQGVPETKVDGTRPLQIQKREKEGFAIADYGHVKVGLHFDATGKLDRVYNNPTAVYDKAKQDQPNVYERVKGKDGTERWFSRPNGAGNNKDQYALPGELAINEGNCQFTRMLIGEMDPNTHEPKDGSSYQRLQGGLENGKRVISRNTMETDGTAYGLSYMGDSATAYRINYLPVKNGEWEKLEQRSGQPANHYYGTITTAGANGTLAADSQYLMANPRMEDDGTFSYDHYVLSGGYFHAAGKRAYHRPDGSLKWSQPVPETQTRTVARR